MRLPTFFVLAILCSLIAADVARAQAGEAPRLGTNRISQSDVATGQFTRDQLRTIGRRIFSTPFNKLDGFGDGPFNPADPTVPGHRPTLQGNGTFLRVNGLDAQTCLECHTITSNATIPATLGIPGVAGAANNAIFQPSIIDVNDSMGAGEAGFNGRFINPPFLFGAGGVELVGKEMTQDLQALKAQAMANPGTMVPLITKGVSFGTLSHNGMTFDHSGIEGVEDDLVVRPFGRKGEFTTTRGFDVGAMSFHFGMQPAEDVGVGVDGDGDGVANEVTAGEMSALHFFGTLSNTPRIIARPNALFGFAIFTSIGCSQCHIPFLSTNSPNNTYAFPQVLDNPSANVYATADLRQPPMSHIPFGAGIAVPMFADLKRHDMGPGLAEDFGGPQAPMFTTARLWGVADTAPYLHDGRALTITDAVLAHGGEALAARNAFAGLNASSRIALLDLLRSLRTPTNPGSDLPPAQEM